MQGYFVEVGTMNYKDFLNDKLNDLRLKEGLPIDIYELKDEAGYFVRCVYSTLKGSQENKRLASRIYNYYFARALAEIIFQNWEGLFVKKILKKEYKMNAQDIEDIVEKSWRNINGEDELHFPETRKHVLVKSILEFLDSHSRFDIEGFMNFRADLYKRELRKQVARAVNDYALEQEQEGFIRILKRFLESQHTIYKTMHIIIKKQGEIQFLDDRGRDINGECLEENETLLKEVAMQGVLPNGQSYIELYEDFLISAILRCAPRQLVVHTVSKQYSDMIDIIDQVLEDKISYCQGCSLCALKN